MGNMVDSDCHVLVRAAWYGCQWDDCHILSPESLNHTVSRSIFDQGWNLVVRRPFHCTLLLLAAAG